MKKLHIILVSILVLGLTSCNSEKEVETNEGKNKVKIEQTKIENNKVSVDKSVNDSDEKLIDEVLETLLEVK